MRQMEKNLTIDIAISVDKFVSIFNNPESKSVVLSLDALNKDIDRVIQKYGNKVEPWIIIAKFDNVIKLHDYLTSYVVSILGCNSRLVNIQKLSDYTLLDRSKTITRVTKTIIKTIQNRERNENIGIKLSIFIKKLISSYSNMFSLNYILNNSLYNEIFERLIRTGSGNDIIEKLTQVLTETDPMLVKLALENNINKGNLTELAISNVVIVDSDSSEESYAKLNEMMRTIDNISVDINKQFLEILSQIVIINIYNDENDTNDNNTILFTIIYEIIYLVICEVSKRNVDSKLELDLY